MLLLPKAEFNVVSARQVSWLPLNIFFLRTLIRQKLKSKKPSQAISVGALAMAESLKQSIRQFLFVKQKSHEFSYPNIDST